MRSIRWVDWSFSILAKHSTPLVDKELLQHFPPEIWAIRRFSYSFDDRYFGEFNFGYNGSEKFSEENRFGFFPYRICWITSNEKWFKEALPSVNLFKLRYTYGLVGNDAISAPSDRFFYLSDVISIMEGQVILGN